MANKKQIQDLKEEIDSLKEEIERLNDLLVINTNQIADFSIANERLEYKLGKTKLYNNYLLDEKDRLLRSDNIHRDKCISLMEAIAVLGKHEIQRSSSEIWHSCQPRSLEAAEVNTNEKLQ